MHGTHSDPLSFTRRKTRPRGRAGYCNRLALWSAANLAGMETGLLVIREPFFRRLLNKISGKRRRQVIRMRRPSSEQALPILADAIVGSNKLNIHSVFGPPRGAVFNHPANACGAVSFWDSAIWYYPLPRDGFIAMSIIFDDDSAKSVEFFETPVAEAENQTAA
jgi:hypothetical protein